MASFQVIALYKEGHDGLGEEVLSSVADKGGLGVRLLHVAVLRLTKHIYESEDHARKLAAVKPELMSRFCQLQDEARELRVDCGLKARLPTIIFDCSSSFKLCCLKMLHIDSLLNQACKELFVFLCGVGGLDDDSMQINYECLSLIQIFLKQEEGGVSQ